MSIRKELTTEITQYEKIGRRNYTANYLLSLTAVLASFFAGLSIALEWFGKDILAVLSAIPATVLITSDRFKLGERTKWAYGKAFALRGILSALEFEGLSEAEASKRRSEINAEYEERWPGISQPPK